MAVVYRERRPMRTKTAQTLEKLATRQRRNTRLWSYWTILSCRLAVQIAAKRRKLPRLMEKSGDPAANFSHQASASKSSLKSLTTTIMMPSTISRRTRAWLIWPLPSTKQVRASNGQNQAKIKVHSLKLTRCANLRRPLPSWRQMLLSLPLTRKSGRRAWGTASLQSRCSRRETRSSLPYSSRLMPRTKKTRASPPRYSKWDDLTWLRIELSFLERLE